MNSANHYYIRVLKLLTVMLASILDLFYFFSPLEMKIVPKFRHVVKPDDNHGSVPVGRVPDLYNKSYYSCHLKTMPWLVWHDKSHNLMFKLFNFVN